MQIKLLKTIIKLLFSNQLIFFFSFVINFLKANIPFKIKVINQKFGCLYISPLYLFTYTKIIFAIEF